MFKVEKSPFGLSIAFVFFNTVSFYFGRTDHWGIGAEISLYDRSITFEILNLYAGVEVYHRND
jgi:hypothetical protein